MSNIKVKSIKTSTPNDILQKLESDTKFKESIKNLLSEISKTCANDAAAALEDEITYALYTSSGYNYSSGDIDPSAINKFDIEHRYRHSITTSETSGDIKTILEVTIDGDGLYRPSMVEGYDDGIENILDLLDSGYDKLSQTVSGKWHGDYALSLDQRYGANFFDRAAKNFMHKYKNKYGIASIKIKSTCEDAKYGGLGWVDLSW